MGAVLDNSNLNEAQGWAASAVARQRNYFESGATRSYAFRLRQLKKLKEAIAQYQGQIQDALHADIGRPPFEAYIEISTAIEDLKHLKHATRNTRVPLWEPPSRGRTVRSTASTEGRSGISACDRFQKIFRSGNVSLAKTRVRAASGAPTVALSFSRHSPLIYFNNFCFRYSRVLCTMA